MTPSVQETDVLISGCGPVGALTANLLGQHGVRTLVLERELVHHGQPRAITCDDEALRIYQSVGFAEVMDAHMYTCPEVELVGASGELFARLGIQETDFGNGYPALRFFSQPYVERVLRQGVARFPHVELRFGQQVEAYTQDAQGLTVTVRDVRLGTEHTVRARYLLACDGGRSTLRRLAGIDMVGSTYDEGMVAVSLLLPEEPPAVCRMVCDPHRHVFVTRCAGNELRVEYMIREDEKAEDMIRPERIREFISPYVDPDRVTVLRAAPYIFNRRVAARWRDGRMFLLGDAAHLMPPVLGQGLCSGLRDAANLSWKLAAVLHGQADESLLDTYELERRPHAEAMLQASVNMGRLVLTGSRPLAFLRDRVFQAIDRIPRVHRFIRNLEFKPRPLIPRGFILGESGAIGTRPRGRTSPSPGWRARGAGCCSTSCSARASRCSSTRIPRKPRCEPRRCSPTAWAPGVCDSAHRPPARSVRARWWTARAHSGRGSSNTGGDRRAAAGPLPVRRGPGDAPARLASALRRRVHGPLRFVEPLPAPLSGATSSAG
ncbi:FAD-dependent monooxygenase [Cystobacter fuscus]